MTSGVATIAELSNVVTGAPFNINADPNTYAWTGTPGSSTSTETTPASVVRTNRCPNGSFEYGLTGWSANDATQSRDSGWSEDGGYCIKVVSTGTTDSFSFMSASFTAGHTYTISATIRLDDALGGTASSHARRISIFDATFAHNYWSTQAPNEEGEIRVSATFTAALTNSHQIRLYSGHDAVGATVYWDSVLIEESATAGKYFDGDSAGWTGITAPTGSYTVVAEIDTATELDQIMLTRDSNPGTIAFEDPDGKIQIYDSASYRTASASHTIGPDEYSDIDMEFDMSHIINTLTLTYFTKVKVGKKETKQVPHDVVYKDTASIAKYGPFRPAKPPTIHKKADFADYATKVFARNADPELVPASVTVPIITASDLLPGFEDGQYVGQKVDIVLPDGITYFTCRVARIQHQISPTRWAVQIFLRDQHIHHFSRKQHNSNIANNQDGTILTDHLEDDAVTTDKIVDGGVTTGKLDDAAVTNGKIADGTIAAAKVNFVVNDIGGVKFTVSSSAPSSPSVGDIWSDSANGYVLKRWSGSAWVSIQDAAIGTAQTTADGKNTIFTQSGTPTAKAVGDQWIDTGHGNVLKIWNGTTWVSVQDAAIVTAQTTADGKNTIFTQSGTPTAKATGDQWIDTGHGNLLKIWSGSAWVAFQDIAIGTAQTTADGKNTIFTQSGTPTAKATGDQWIDTGHGNIIKIWNGTTWGSVQDTAISTAQTAAGAAQTTADGKNTVHYSTSAPGSTANVAGDIWFRTSGTLVTEQWKGTGGTSWTQVTLDNAVIANIDAGKITSGFIDAARIDAQTITVDKLLVGGGHNIAANPGFETGSIAPHVWQDFLAASITSTGPRTGQKALLATLKTAGAGTYNTSVVVNGAFGDTAAAMPCKMGDVAHAEVYAMKVSGTAGSCQVAIYQFDNTGSVLGSATGTPVTLTGSYQKVTCDYTVATGVAYVMAEILFGDGSVSGATIRIDDLWFGIKTTGTLIVDGTITATNIATGTITATQIASATITAANIAANTITASQIAANTVTASQIAAGTITATEIAATTITAAKIASGTITATQIASGTITGTQIAGTTITASNITSGTITTTQIAAGTIVAGNVAASAGLNPVGAMVMYAGASAPTGWLKCDGSTFSSVTYPALAALVGDTYGAHSGTTYFLPDMSGRFPIGVDGSHALGTGGGGATHTITTSELPPHTHTINHGHDSQKSNTAGSTTSTFQAGNSTVVTNTAPLPIVNFTGSSGNGPGASLAMDIMNPYRSVTYIIKT